MRVLSVSRVRVGPGQREQWLAALGRLAARAREQGGHVWVFRHPDDATLHLEFREGPGGTGAADDEGLDALADYERDGVAWREVPLGRPHEGDHATSHH